MIAPRTTSISRAGGLSARAELAGDWQIPRFTPPSGDGRLLEFDDFGLPTYGVLAPAGTPREIVLKLNRELRRIIDSPETKAKAAALGFEAFSSSPDELGAHVKVQLETWTRMIQDAGIKPE